MTKPKRKPSFMLNLVDYQENSIVSSQLLKKENGNVTLFAFSVGQTLSEHTAPFDAIVYVLEGSAEVSIDKETITVNNGEEIVLPANIPHSVKAKERFKMLLIMVRS